MRSFFGGPSTVAVFALVISSTLGFGSTVALATPINVAPSGTGIIGSTTDPTMNGTENDHAGSNTNINDNNPSTHVDNYPGGPNQYTGVTFASPVNNVAEVQLQMAMFVDGGWFGPNNTTPVPETH